VRQGELVAWRGLKGRHLSHAGDGQWRSEELETRWLIANLVACLLPISSGGFQLRIGRSAHASKIGQHLACREARRASAVSGDLGVSL
jgi:hypothetical protein